MKLRDAACWLISLLILVLITPLAFALFAAAEGYYAVKRFVLFGHPGRYGL